MSQSPVTRDATQGGGNAHQNPSPVPDPNSSAKTKGEPTRRFRVAPPKSVTNSQSPVISDTTPATSLNPLTGKTQGGENAHRNPSPVAREETVTSDRSTSSPSPPAPDAPDAPPSSQTFLKKRGFWIAVAILVTLGAISQIRLRPSVRAEAWLEPDPNARRVVHMEIPGTIRQVLVLPNQTVREGQPLALVESESLEEEIEDTQLNLLQNNAELHFARQQMLAARSRWEQAKAVESMARLRSEKLRREVHRMDAGIAPEHIAPYEFQLQSLQSRLQKMKASVARHESLVTEGVYSREQIDALYREVDAIEALLGEHRAKMEAAKRQLRDEFDTRQDELNRLSRVSATAEREYEAAKTFALSQIPVQKQLEKRLEKRQTKSNENEVLLAPLAGTVTTQDLYALKGKMMQPGDAVLEIAQTSKLVAIIEVRQEDRDLVKEGATVKFSPPEPGLPSFETQIREIVSVLAKDEQLDKSILQVIAVIEQGGQLQPGAKVYAKIASPYTISLAERVRREFLNLFKVRKYSRSPSHLYVFFRIA
ncbi:MAG: efflux RND transporter periplasmic adaptor subunit [Cyanobacteria bacterium SBLK]|nr:efflux RND transporter periplasmic adaptor subunit [Cyanobacteria bacterium SBLK]